jgi:hypothetical protein
MAISNGKNKGERVMAKGTNEWFGDEYDKETFEPDPDREHDDWKLRQLEEEEQQQKEKKKNGSKT